MRRIVLTPFLIVFACSNDSSTAGTDVSSDELQSDAYVLEVLAEVEVQSQEAIIEAIGEMPSEELGIPETLDQIPVEEVALETLEDSASEMVEIYGEEEVSPYYETCLELFPCVQACSDNACKMACISHASKQAVDDLMALKQCIDEQCPECDEPPEWKKEQCDECRQAAVSGPACSALFWKCYPQQGTKHCGEILNCVLACKDQQCRGSCVNEGDAEAKFLLEALRVCAFTACPDAPDPNDPCIISTLDAVCKDEYLACLNDS